MSRSPVLAFGLLGASALVLLASAGEGFAFHLPKGLPRWFRMLDVDGDGKISLAEWKKGGKPEDEFKRMDHDGDGFLTKEEVFRRPVSKLAADRLEFKAGRASLDGEIEMSSEDKRFGKRPLKCIHVKFEKGKTYRIEQTAKAYRPLLLLDNPGGTGVAFNGSMAKGQPAVISHAAAEDGVYRITAMSQDGIKGGPFSLTVRVHTPGVKELPRWLEAIDKDGDGQVSLREWLDAGEKREEFRKHDLDKDGFITVDEAAGPPDKKGGNALQLVKGKASYKGEIAETPGEMFRSKRSYKIFTIRMETGKTYRIEMVSDVYFSYLYLEGPGGEILGRGDSHGNGQAARIVHPATTSGTYRIIATSQGGFRSGPFSMTVRVAPPGAKEGLPKWFEALDKDEDGQVSLREWLDGGKTEDDFRDQDMNGDGFITADEALRATQGDPKAPKK